MQDKNEQIFNQAGKRKLFLNLEYENTKEKTIRKT